MSAALALILGALVLLAVLLVIAIATWTGYRNTVDLLRNTGEVVAGNVGAEDRLGYTVHGDTVNVAARLDDLNKELGTTLLVSEATVRQLGDPAIELRKIGQTRIRGKTDFVDVFEIP